MKGVLSLANEKKSTFFGGAAILAASAIAVKLIGAVYRIPLGNILPDDVMGDYNSAYNIYNFFLTIDMERIRRELNDYAMPRIFG